MAAKITTSANFPLFLLKSKHKNGPSAFPERSPNAEGLFFVYSGIFFYGTAFLIKFLYNTITQTHSAIHGQQGLSAIQTI